MAEQLDSQRRKDQAVKHFEGVGAEMPLSQRQYSSAGSSPSSGSLHASTDENEPVRGTSPATSSDIASVATPFAGLKVDTNPIEPGKSPAFGNSASAPQHPSGRSPNPLDAQDGRRLATRGGLTLATMHEESSDANEFHRDAPLSAGPVGIGFTSAAAAADANLRPSRHRSTSSAAALALHGPGASSSFADRWSSSATGRITSSAASALSSRAIWDRDAAAGGGGVSASTLPRPMPQLQRGFSANFVSSHTDPRGSSTSPSPFLSSPGGLHDTGPFDFGGLGQSIPRSSFRAASSPFGPPGDLPELSSYPGLDNETASRAAQAASGSESRRHSVAGATADQEPLGIIGSHRRAIGFDVQSSNPFSSEAARRHMPGRQTFGGFGGGSGSLTLSVDDLADDFDFQPLRDELARAHQQQQQQQRRAMQDRFSQGSASETLGSHAASMPSGLEERGFDAFQPGSMTQSGNKRSLTGAAGARARASGLESLSASWDVLLSPSHQLAQPSLADMTQQLRQMSFGSERAAPGRPHAHTSSLSHEHAEGTETVHASPGTSPTNMRSVGGHRDGAGSRQTLSAQAKSFTTHLPTPPPSSDRMPSSPFTSAQHLGPPSSSFAGAMPTAPAAAAVTSLPPSHLVDLAFSSLAALGPMPPPSMGPMPPLPAGAGSSSELQDLGKGVPLANLPKETPLYIVEFKQGRTDLFFRASSPSQSPGSSTRDAVRRGDLVIVEADRGKDLGTVVNDSITVEQVQAFLAHQSELTLGAVGGLAGTHGGVETMSTSSGEDATAGGGGGGGPGSSSVATFGTAAARPMRTINPKRLFTKATPADTSTLYSKAQDEERALQLCIAKVGQRGLPMTVVAAEMQWDRRKLTFYYTASMRVDFRDLVKELFRLYKTRIWMCHLGHPSGTGMG
ncbi:hypothetical protein BCV70DRAFT_212158 [Testicularia cyperi]|uniref:PSP1 C-terminal domain-containing protein n=1 Tax=Testicularia cyperi TaxID=1882483 RepID=A0A317XLZ4_9BASI|nr:hypothetical protein BCV70DRAFT_212158 [Testicularia cyperi]